MATAAPHRHPELPSSPAGASQTGTAPRAPGKLRFAIALLPDAEALKATVADMTDAGIVTARMCVISKVPAKARPRRPVRSRNASAARQGREPGASLRSLDCIIGSDGRTEFQVAATDAAETEYDADLAAYLLSLSQSRQSQQLLQHLAHEGVALVVRTSDENEQRLISDRLLQCSHIGVQTHTIRRR